MVLVCMCSLLVNESVDLGALTLRPLPDSLVPDVLQSWALYTRRTLSSENGGFRFFLSGLYAFSFLASSASWEVQREVDSER